MPLRPFRKQSSDNDRLTKAPEVCRDWLPLNYLRAGTHTIESARGMAQRQ
jgi:hypothetical protein